MANAVCCKIVSRTFWNWAQVGALIVHIWASSASKPDDDGSMAAGAGAAFAGSGGAALATFGFFGAAAAADDTFLFGAMTGLSDGGVLGLNPGVGSLP